MSDATSFPKSEIKVLLLENIHQSAIDIFGNEGFKVETISKALPEDELVKKLEEGVHVLGIRSKTRVTRRALEAGKRLLSVGCFCIGTNQVDLEGAKASGVPVFNAPFSNTRSVAELVICEIVMLARQLGDRSREVHEGKWRKVATSSYEIRGKTLGIIGYGHIGSQVGVLAEAMGMRVVSYDIRATLPMGNNKAVDSLDALLRQSDFVTLHVPETPQTKNMIGEAELAKMKEGAYLLNLSRGTVVDLDALAQAIKSKRLGGAALDVYPEEPESNSDGFTSIVRGLPNVVLTPHIGGSTLEAQEAIGREVANVLTRFTNTGATTGAVNFPGVDLPPLVGAHRVLNVHRNVPGVLRDINRLVSERNANVIAQQLATDPTIGYLVMDLDKEVANDVRHAIAELKTSIKTRILY
ncbi:D-3-phosphoglycerate dehydrogenase [Labilithrix luteola]|uniref:D-3-phosphoglycerate dehydrogenase n=1 Tax=Labilithrix luteola TaxID=1391654 RepID=A0A0K1QEF5_9BACT|nr:phosphoglycerate dehydrogenase [Labilithrix luteola]AKV04113.1 D-3-phosphoglycerate dehydrogenase [Labilithrix luteola]